jgi:hypothetical protein
MMGSFTLMPIMAPMAPSYGLPMELWEERIWCSISIRDSKLIANLSLLNYNNQLHFKTLIGVLVSTLMIVLQVQQL